ncbi:MAG: EamA family transporter, partial [Bacteroidales bacterium]|nr:EamA family transporter [Bacteroidales bacterium]
MTNSKAYLSIIASMIFWSFSFIWSKEALAIYSPLTILFFRLSLASLTLLSFAKIIGKLDKVEKGDWKYFLLLSFFEPFLYFLGETYGLQRVSPTIASVLIATIPLFLPFVGYYVFKEKLTGFKITGTALSFTGVLLVIINADMNLNADIWGILLLLVAVFSAVSYTTLVNKLAHKYNAFTIVGWQSLLALIGFAPLFFIFEWTEASNIGLVWEGVRPILLLGLFASIFAFVFFTYSIKKLGVTKAGIFSN